MPQRGLIHPQASCGPRSRAPESHAHRHPSPHQPAASSAPRSRAARCPHSAAGLSPRPQLQGPPLCSHWYLCSLSPALAESYPGKVPSSQGSSAQRPGQLPPAKPVPRLPAAQLSRGCEPVRPWCRRAPGWGGPSADSQDRCPQPGRCVDRFPVLAAQGPSPPPTPRQQRLYQRKWKYATSSAKGALKM